MWKTALAFVVFAAVVMYVLTKSGGNVDMRGEKHGADAISAPEAAASPAGGASR